MQFMLFHPQSALSFCFSGHLPVWGISTEHDSSGRVDRVLYEHSTTTLDDLVLTYNGLGLISRIDRLYDGASPVLGVRRDYEYDAAYRLAKESYTEIESGSPDTYTLKSYRACAYDAAGNRSTMTRWNTTDSKVTTYTYGDREELDSSTEYEHDGSSLTGNVTYDYDDRGNTEYRRFANGFIEWDYEWNENDRLVMVTKLDYDDGDEWEDEDPAEAYNVEYGYDSAGRRIWKKETDGSYTRSWFNGLTEEIRKTSVGSDDPTDFVKHLQEDGDSYSEWRRTTGLYMTVIDDSDRRSDILELHNYRGGDWAVIGDDPAGWNTNDDPWASEDRVAAFWYKGAAELRFYIEADSSDRELVYFMAADSSGLSGSNVHIYLGAGAQKSSWTRWERNLAQDFEAYSSEEFEVVNGVLVKPSYSTYSTGPGGHDQHFFYLDDLSLSDAQTVEHNVLGPGVIGHILRHRTWSTSTYAATDKWFGYDQVGSVLHETNSAGNLSTRHYQDAWGNVQQSYTTGLWNSGAGGWHHNTKEADADAGLVYMFQRWYGSASGTFASVAPYPPMMEHPYGFAANNPGGNFDPLGEWVDWVYMGPIRKAPVDLCANIIHQFSKLRRKKGATKVLGQFRHRMPWGGGAPITSTTGYTTGLYGPSPTNVFTRPIGGVYPGLGIAIGGALLIGTAGNLTVQSFTALEEASAEESQNNIDDMRWSSCNSKCKATSATGMAYRACMRNCGGF